MQIVTRIVKDTHVVLSARDEAALLELVGARAQDNVAVTLADRISVLAAVIGALSKQRFVCCVVEGV